MLKIGFTLNIFLWLMVASVAQAQSSTSPDAIGSLEQSVKIACVANATAGMLSRSWFGTDGRDRILTIAQGAALRESALAAGYDPVLREEDRFRKQLTNESNYPQTPAVSGDISCLTNYLDLLAAIDGPSRALVQQHAAQALATKNEQQLQQTAQQLQLQHDQATQANEEALQQTAVQLQIQQEQADEAAEQKRAADELAAQQDAIRVKAANNALDEQQADIQAGIAAAHFLPRCDTDQTLRALRGAMFLGGFTVQSFDHSVDASSQPFGGTGSEPERYCTAHFVTNAQDGQITFGIKWTDSTHSDIDIQFMNNP